MEESTSPLPGFKTFVSLCRKLKAEGDEKNKLALQRQLDVSVALFNLFSIPFLGVFN